jgi:[acyl-carrier-protein] S-malonyltransferase
MSKVAYVFPGQGSQVVGMGKELFGEFSEARSVFAAADDALNERLSTLCFEGPDEALKLTANTQPAILAVSVAAHAVFSSRGPAPVLVAGHSLGEYSALVAAGGLALQDAVRAVRARGQAMQEAVPEGVGSMAAVLGLLPEKVREVCEAAAQGEVVSPANYNSPEQTVIAGHVAAVQRASTLLKEAGAKRVVPLPVSAPFHCALMEPVKGRLGKVLQSIQVAPLRCPLVANVTAQPVQDAALVPSLLVEQVTQSVRWVESVEALARLGVTHVIELGPGKVLSGLIKRISKDVEIFNVEDEASLNRTLASVAG